MKLLFLSPEPVLSRTQGTTLRIRGLVRELAKRHEVSILAFGEPPARKPAWLQSYDCVPSSKRSRFGRLRALASGRADLGARRWSEAFASALSNLMDATRFDAVFFEGLEMCPYLDVLDERDARPIAVYDAHNAEHVLQRRAFETDRLRALSLPGACYSRIQWRRLEKLEARVCRQVDLVVCTSEPDRRALGDLVPELDAVVVPNGIHADDMASPPMVVSKRTRGSIVFVGKMDYRPNRDGAVWFTRSVLPLVRAQCPAARFLIVGREPSRSVRALERYPGVQVTGEVTDTAPYFREAAVSVAPLRMGSGTRIKILEALALGTPTVTTSIGAEGLDLASGRHIAIADTAPDFATSVVSFLEDREHARSIGDAGRRHVLERYDWARVIPALETALAARA